MQANVLPFIIRTLPLHWCSRQEPDFVTNEGQFLHTRAEISLIRKAAANFWPFWFHLEKLSNLQVCPVLSFSEGDTETGTRGVGSNMWTSVSHTVKHGANTSESPSVFPSSLFLCFRFEVSGIETWQIIIIGPKKVLILPHCTAFCFIFYFLHCPVCLLVQSPPTTGIQV